jgi:hypothetical protein
MPLVSFTNLDSFKRQLDEAVAEIRSAVSLKPLAEQRDQLKTILGQASERTIDAQQYIKLSDRYRKQKEQRGLDPRILVATGKMLEGLKSGESFDPKLEDNNTISITITDPIAFFHQTGKGRLPERPVIEPDERLIQDIADAAFEQIAADLRSKF